MSKVLELLSAAIEAAQEEGYNESALESLLNAGDFVHGLEEQGIAVVPAATPVAVPPPVSPVVAAANVVAQAAADADDDSDNDDQDDVQEVVVTAPVSPLAGHGPIILSP